MGGTQSQQSEPLQHVAGWRGVELLDDQMRTLDVLIALLGCNRQSSSKAGTATIGYAYRATGLQGYRATGLQSANEDLVKRMNHKFTL
jgi:hypothetical protein